MHRIISVIDLLSCAESKEILKNEDEKAFEQLLFDIGFDINQHIDYQICLHRPMSYLAADKHPVEAGRWIGVERKDSAWLESEHCTYDNKLEIIGTKDLEFQKELVAMSQPPNFTLNICEHLKENSVEGW